LFLRCARNLTLRFPPPPSPPLPTPKNYPQALTETAGYGVIVATTAQSHRNRVESSLDLALSLIAGLCVVTLAVSIAAISIAVRKAPPESNEALALRVSNLHIQVEELYDAVDKWGRRQSVRESRARSKAANDDDQAQGSIDYVPSGTVTGARTGILRQPAAMNVRTQPTGR